MRNPSILGCGLLAVGTGLADKIQVQRILVELVSTYAQPSSETDEVSMAVHWGH